MTNNFQQQSKPDKRIYKKRINKITYNEFSTIKRWLLTGSFNNKFYDDESIDTSKLFLVRKAVMTEADALANTILSYKPIAIKKESLFIAFILLSSGNYQAKKVFKRIFNKFIISADDLFLFFSLIKKYRGFGSLIHATVKQWFKNKPVSELERMFTETNAKYNWQIKDILNLVRIQPRDKKETLLLNYFKGNKENNIQSYDKILPLVYIIETLKSNNAVVLENDYYIKYNFTRELFPSNYIITKDEYSYLLKNLSNDNLILKLKKKYNISEYVDEFYNRFEDKKYNTNLSITELVSITNYLTEKGASTKLISKMLEVIYYKFKFIKTKKNILNITDMSEEMFATTLKHITPAVIASINSSYSDKIFTFSGKERVFIDKLSVLESEGRSEEISEVNYKLLSYKDLTKIIVWTNKQDLTRLEKSLIKMKEIHPKLNIYLFNLNKSKIKPNDYFYTINGYNYKILKLILNNYV